MQKQSVPTKTVRKRKFLFVLPILVLPFVTFLLWSLGVVGETPDKREQVTQEGYNFTLPSALPGEDSSWDKLKFYEKADKDSAKRHSLMKNDPYFNLSSLEGTNTPNQDSTVSLKMLSEKEMTSSYNPYPNDQPGSTDPNEAKVYKKLAQLNNEINKSKDLAKTSNYQSSNEPKSLPSSNDQQLNQLQSIMQNSQGSTGTDPEMQQIDGMLEKILDIQHPDRVKEKIKQSSEINAQKVYPVLLDDQSLKISTLQSANDTNRKLSPGIFKSTVNRATKSDFYSLNETGGPDVKSNVIEAIINETQTIQSGGTVKVQLENDVYINGILIPRNQYLYGVGNLNGDRLYITIKSIHYNHNILPVSLSVFDLDGQEGINIPGTMSRDVSKQSAEQAIQGIGLASLDPSIGAQAASAGIQAAKSLIGKKTKLVKLTIRGSYRILLRDDNL